MPEHQPHYTLCLKNEPHRKSVELYGANASWEDASLSDDMFRIIDFLTASNSAFSMWSNTCIRIAQAYSKLMKTSFRI